MAVVLTFCFLAQKIGNNNFKVKNFKNDSCSLLIRCTSDETIAGWRLSKEIFKATILFIFILNPYITMITKAFYAQLTTPYTSFSFPINHSINIQLWNNIFLTNIILPFIKTKLIAFLTQFICNHNSTSKDRISLYFLF